MKRSTLKSEFPPVSSIKPWPAIEEVSVENLFGRYSYEKLNFRPNPEEDVVVLYGENGAGKTTILRLIYSCLSPLTGEGNRTYLSKTPFSKLKIKLMNGSNIEIIKSKALLGSYSFQFDDFHLDVHADKDFKVLSVSCTRFRRHQVRCFMEQEVRHGEAEVHARVQA